jgi:hypothetical protein
MANDFNLCPKCGQPLGDKVMVVACESCLHRSFMEEALVQEPELMALAGGRLRVEIAPDQKHQRHIALFTNPNFGYCGTQLLKVPHKRRRVPDGELPVGLCEVCLQGYQRAQKAKEKVT